MHSKVSVEQEGFYWKKQIERHHIGKRIRNLIRQEINKLDKHDKEKPYKSLAAKLNVDRRTVWALANGLATASKDFIDRLEKLEVLINEKIH
jgi:ribosome-binding protein aMBF1 (putative translation factor)